MLLSPDDTPSLWDSLWANLWIGALLLAAVAPYGVSALTAAMQKRVARRTRDLLASAGIELESEAANNRRADDVPVASSRIVDAADERSGKHGPPVT